MRDISLSLSPEDEAAREEALAIAEQLDETVGEDFDAFWAAQDRKPTTLRNVFGRDVTLPPALPLRFEVEAKRVSESQSEEDTRRMVGILFGDDALEFWTARGCDLEQFAVLLMYGTANTRQPGSMKLAEARQSYLERIAAKDAEAGKATAAGSGPASAATGPRSRPTSPASTRSRKKK